MAGVFGKLASDIGACLAYARNLPQDFPIMKPLRCLLLAWVLVWMVAPAAAEVFGLAIIPDTQNEITGNTAQFANRLKWLVDHRRILNLKMVLQSGELVNWDTPAHEQFEKASTQLKALDDAGIPYAIALGNHDTAAVKPGGSAAPGNVNANLRITTTYNTFFPASRFRNLAGAYEEGKMDNAWHTFVAGDLNWLVLNLELWPRPKVIEWAKTVIAEHPHHNVILLTHSFLTAKGAIE